MKEEKDETIKYLFDPIYLSAFCGLKKQNSKVEDDLRILKIFDEVGKKEYYISEINCYFNKYVNYLEVEYTNKITKQKMSIKHAGNISKFYYRKI